MRLPLVTNLSSRDGTSHKNARMYNVLAEKKRDQLIAQTRPGLITANSFGTSNGNGLVDFNGELFSVYGATVNRVVTGAVGNEWTAGSGTPYGYNVLSNAISWNGSVFVIPLSGVEAPDLAGLLSIDGITWTQVEIPFSLSLSGYVGIAWNGSVFCAVAGTEAATSPNGTVWTARAFPYFAVSMAWNGSVFCVLQGAVAKSVVSVDGIAWAEYDMPSGDWVSITAGNGLFCAVGTGTICATSKDGRTWTLGVLPAYQSWRGIAHNGSVFCAVGMSYPDGGFTTIGAISDNGLNWQITNMPDTYGFGGEVWSAIASDGIQFCAVSSNNSQYSATSTDGIFWVTHKFPGVGGRFVVGSDGMQFVSIDTSPPSSASYYITPDSNETHTIIQVGTVTDSFFDFVQSPL